MVAPCIACKDDVPLAAQVSATKYAATIVEKHILRVMDTPARPLEFQAGQLKKKRKKKKKSGKSSPLLGMQRAGTLRAKMVPGPQPTPMPSPPPCTRPTKAVRTQRRSQSVHDITVVPEETELPVSRQSTFEPGTPRSKSKVSLSAQGISKSRSNTPEASPRGSQEMSHIRASFLSPRARTLSAAPRTQT